MTDVDDTIALEEFLPYRLARMAGEISRQLREVYKDDHGLTIPEWRTLATLGQFGTVTAKAIGAHASMHKTKVSRAVAALETRRWLQRAQNPDDRREDLLSLTAPGRRAYRHLVPKMRAFEDAIIAQFAETGAASGSVDLFATLDALERILGIENQRITSARPQTD
ncbi:MAG: MarR family transcriptional regulator [Pseudomonadota bacterium]